MVNFVGGSTSSRLGSPAFWPMWVRRMATVTICAPLASMARRVSSKSRYFPVPTRRREAYGLPAMRRGSLATDTSTASHGDHDLDAVAVGEPLAREAAARDDLAVPLDGQPPAGQRHFLEPLGEGERGREIPGGPGPDEGGGA